MGEMKKKKTSGTSAAEKGDWH